MKQDTIKNEKSLQKTNKKNQRRVNSLNVFKTTNLSMDPAVHLLIIPICPKNL